MNRVVLKMLGLLLGLVLLSSIVPAYLRPQEAELPAQTVERFLTLPHGLSRLSPEDKARLDRVINNPGPYVSALRSLYGQIDPVVISRPEGVLRYERAILLLGVMKNSEAAAELARWYRSLEETASDEHSEGRNSALGFQRTILNALDDQKEESLSMFVLGNLDQMDYASRVAALRYFARTSVGDQKVTEGLRRYFTDQRSPLFQDQDIARMLEFLTQQK